MESKWWEYYAVRYFVGTVIGAVIVAFLNAQPGSPYEGRLVLAGDPKEVTFLGVGLVAALGFAYCYIASSPVLLLHTLRAHLQLQVLKARWVIHLSFLVIAAALSIWIALRVLPPYIATAVGLAVGVQFGLVAVALATKFSVVEGFYRQLADARSKALRKKDEPLSAGSEYVTSYRHLREHGNAFMIVILEGMLAWVLFHLPSATCAFLFIAIWLLPSSFAWMVGTVLESRFSTTPLP